MALRSQMLRTNLGISGRCRNSSKCHHLKMISKLCKNIRLSPEKKERSGATGGFSLIEVFIAIGIIIVLALIAFLNLNGRKTTVNLTGATQQVATLLREAQTRSVSGSSNTFWGVHFANTTSSPFYALYSTAYTPANTVNRVPLPVGICYDPSSIAAGSSLDVTFNKLSGLPSGSATIALKSCSGGTAGVGSIPSWSNTTALPSAISSHSAVAYKGYIYTMGGNAAGGATSTVFYAPINSNGTVGVWATTTPLPSALYAHSAVVYNGYIYLTGGCNCAFTTSTVLYARINSDGSIGNWTNTTPLLSTLRYHSAVVYNGYIYTTGECTLLTLALVLSTSPR
jgi:type II secretory pathway pseudopilin PulG